MLNVGCQPPWRRFSVEGLPICDNSNLLTQFGQQYNRITQMVKNELIEETKCLVPCTFMEYKVGNYMYRVSGLSCPQAGGWKSAILRGFLFPDVFGLYGPFKADEISLRYS